MLEIFSADLADKIDLVMSAQDELDEYAAAHRRAPFEAGGRSAHRPHRRRGSG
ncbi:MAG: hypothetical protein R2713_16120 [Ilumatobacteraceae bacterium]